MEDFIKNYGALLLTFFIEVIIVISYIVRSNTKHEANINRVEEKLDDHIKQDEKAMNEMKESFNINNINTNIKLDKIDNKLNEICLKFERLTGWIDHFKENKEC